MEPVISTLKINKKLLTFQNSVDTIKKDAKNPHFKSTYATLHNMLSEVKPILNANQIILTQPVKDNRVYSIITDTESGEFLDSYVDLPPGTSPQALGSAITYYRRYTLAALLALEIEDDDGNEASHVSNQTSTEKQWLNKWTDKNKTATTELWTKVVSAIQTGKRTLDQVKETYKLNKELESELTEIAKGVVI